MTTATYAFRRNQNLYRQRTAVQLGPISASFVVIAVVSVLALLYLNQITKTNVFGVKVTELSRQRDQVMSQQQDLQIEAARLQSINRIQSSPTVKTMVPEGQVSYAK